MSSLYSLFLIKRTQLQLVADRGYDLGTEADILKMTYEAFIDYLKSKVNADLSIRRALNGIYQRPGAKKETILVYYAERTSPSDKQLKGTSIMEFISTVQQGSYHEVILITDLPVSPEGKNNLVNLIDVKWQIFNDYELTYNPIHHVDTPLHELMTAEEAEKKLKAMKVDLSGLLIMKSDESIVKYYGWPVGGVVKIHRDYQYIDILAPKSMNYRVIVG
jgi:DNA-directed RNA polymerase subunit H (RpoH/RPB5)